MTEALSIYFAIMVAMIGGLMLWLPRLSRRELFFSVTVPATFPKSETARPILRRYDARVAVITLVAVALVVRGAVSLHLWLSLAALVAQLAGCFWAFLSAHKAAVPHAVPPTTLREAALAPRPMRLVGGWPLQLAPFAILAAVGAALHANWDRIPLRFPVHWGIDGQPNGWSTRTPLGVFGPLILGALVSALMLLLAWGISHWTRRVHATGGAASADLARERRCLLIIICVEFLVAVDLSWTALLPLRANPVSGPAMAVPLGGMVLFVLLLPLLFLVHRPQELMPAEGEPTIGDRTEDRYWKAGVFYVNPNDPALMVEKRFGIGYTLNFGHWASWLIMVALLALPLTAMFLARHH